MDIIKFSVMSNARFIEAAIVCYARKTEIEDIINFYGHSKL